MGSAQGCVRAPNEWEAEGLAVGRSGGVTVVDLRTGRWTWRYECGAEGGAASPVSLL